MEEVWKDIEGYEGLYRISNKGRVKSLARPNNSGRNTRTDFIMSLGNTHGYVSVVLCKDSKTKSFLVHRLVAKAFIENPNNYPCINHKDENKTNNNADNLEWCTVKYNNNYGTAKARSGLKHGKRVVQYDLAGNEIRRWNTSAEACRFYGVTRCMVSSACLGITKTACGYKWRYENDI